MKLVERISLVVLIVFISWFLFSWVDVVMHNDPFDGNYVYHPANMFMMIGELNE